jgi:uncharacterized protein (DUF4415 family)
MTARKKSIKSDLTKVDAHRITKTEYDEAPELTKQMLNRAEIRHGSKVIKRGRPPLEHPKEAVKLRLDHDVLAAYRKTGDGWQTRINADLRKAARKLEHDPEKWKPVFPRDKRKRLRGDHAQSKR